MDLTPQVMRVLRDGPFELALATAIDQSGLTLDRLCERLAERGVVVSRATLSYWRQGRSRPERARSLDAVSGLEAVLGLPPSSLLMLLGPRRPRGRWIGHPPGTLSRSVLWASAGPILAHLAAPPEGELVTHSVHDLLTLGPGQLARTLRVRLLVEATVDMAYRLPVFYQGGPSGRQAPRLRQVWYGRPGRVVVDHRHGLTVAEVLLDRPLPVGERAMVEYELELAGDEPLDCYHRRFNRPVVEFVAVVQFGSTLPARCHRYSQRSPDGPERAEGEVWIGGSGSAQLVAVDLPPGIVGLRWS